MSNARSGRDGGVEPTQAGGSCGPQPQEVFRARRSQEAGWIQDATSALAYGVIDRLVTIWLARKARSDIKGLTHKVLCLASEARPSCRSFFGAVDAQANNVDSRKQALRHLRRGGAIGIFPAGAVSGSVVPWRGSAVDIAWHPFAAKQVTEPGRRQHSGQEHRFPKHFKL